MYVCMYDNHVQFFKSSFYSPYQYSLQRDICYEVASVMFIIIHPDSTPNWWPSILSFTWVITVSEGPVLSSCRNRQNMNCVHICFICFLHDKAKITSLMLHDPSQIIEVWNGYSLIFETFYVPTWYLVRNIIRLCFTMYPLHRSVTWTHFLWILMCFFFQMIPYQNCNKNTLSIVCIQEL